MHDINVERVIVGFWSNYLLSPPIEKCTYQKFRLKIALLSYPIIIPVIIIIIIIYTLSARVVWAPKMISQPVSSIFCVLHCSLGLGELQACPFPDVVFPPLLLSALSSSPFHCALQDGFG